MKPKNLVRILLALLVCCICTSSEHEVAMAQVGLETHPVSMSIAAEPQSERDWLYCWAAVFDEKRDDKITYYITDSFAANGDSQTEIKRRIANSYKSWLEAPPRNLELVGNIICFAFESRLDSAKDKEETIDRWKQDGRHVVETHWFPDGH
jgi:hypothetical protein